MKDQISQTLFRFTSLRSPDLSKEKNKELRFIFPSEAAKNDDFYDSMENRPPEVSKWQQLQNIAKDFNAFTKEEIKSIDSKLFEFSEWLAQNRTTASIDEIEEKTIGVTSIVEDGTLWNNLFYQFVTEADFYAKEAVIHLLKANHVIANFPRGEELDIEEKKNLVHTLIYAKVILPKELFDFSEDGTTDAKATKETTTYKTVSLPKKLLVSIASQELQNLEKVATEIDTLHSAYQTAYKAAYEVAKTNHSKSVKAVLDEYEAAVQTAKDDWCTVRGDKVYDASNLNPCDQPAHVKYPDIAEFSFTFRDEIDAEQATTLFSPLAYETLSFLKPVDTIKTFAEAKKLITKEAETLTVHLYENTNFYTKSVSVHGTILPVTNDENDPTRITAAFCSKRRKNKETNLAYWRFFADITNPSEAALFAVQSVSAEVFDISDNLLHSSTSYTILESTLNSVKIGLLSDVLTIPTAQHVNLRLKATVTLLDGTVLSHDQILRPNTCNLGSIAINDETGTSDNQNFIPSGYGMRQLGIADYRKVEQSVHCYTEGEVSHIENVMAREYKEKSTRRLRSSENTVSTTSETEKERLTDTTTTDRFEMQHEIAQVVSESQDFSAFVNSNVGKRTQNGFYFNVNAGANFATHTSSEDSINQAMTEAQEITSRAMDRVVQRVKEERISKIIEEFEENNSHGFDNRKGDKHIVGVYRWIDKVYKNQIYNYGRRLMYEFAIPQPSKLHRLALNAITEDDDSETMILKEPLDPRKVVINNETISDASKITVENYKVLAAQYNAEVNQPPVEEMFIGKAFSYKANDALTDAHESYGEHTDLDIPEGYYTVSAKAEWVDSEDSGEGRTHIIVGGVKMPQNSTRPLSKFVTSIPVSFSSLTHLSGNSNVSIQLKRLDETIETWQLETFNAIVTAYEDKLAAYRSQKVDEDSKIDEMKGSNPLFYRQIEQTVLRKNCLSYLIDQAPTATNTFGKKMYTGDVLDTYNVTVTKSLDDYTSFAKFMEQAFEWDIMSYNFYPFYWGNRNEWNKLYNFENNDPLFRSFMQAGLARVVLTVRPGFEKAVLHYMSTGSIWNGGELPVLDDPLYRSIVDELDKPLGVKEGKAWKTRVPTSLTILQADSLGLKVEKALPCECDDIEDFIESDQTECSSNILNDTTIFNDLQVGDTTAAERKIQLSFLRNFGTEMQTVFDLDNEELFPISFTCMDQEIVIQRDAAWNPEDSAGVVYQELANKISLISGVEAHHVFDTVGNPTGLQFKIDYGRISTFTFEKPNIEGGANDPAHDVLKVNISSEGVIVSSPTKYMQRVQDRYATSLTDGEIDVLLPLARFQ
ncbi:hypothetical protein [Kordia jejudonensis]|uniref:hypothetical protein n=1 Tax=Kordia jejudonensis TaxID=1348245 RepID=UPI0006995F3E|nr:hypothetical protein [Kordia jejudonensis]